MDTVSARQILSMANEGSKVLHPRAVLASLKTKTPIVARNTFSAASGTTIFHNAPTDQSDQVALAHRDEMTLIEFEAKTDAQKIVPEMIRVDECRFVLKKDVYQENRIKELQNKFGVLRTEDNWATISVVFDKPAPENKEIPENEIIHSSQNVICYLLKEDLLSTSLRTLYEHYILAV